MEVSNATSKQTVRIRFKPENPQQLLAEIFVHLREVANHQMTNLVEDYGADIIVSFSSSCNETPQENKRPASMTTHLSHTIVARAGWPQKLCWVEKASIRIYIPVKSI